MVKKLILKGPSQVGVGVVEGPTIVRLLPVLGGLIDHLK